MIRLFFKNQRQNSLDPLVRTFRKMYSQTATELNKLSNNEIGAWLKSFDTVLTDCDGVLWIYNNAIDGAPDVINRFKEIGKKVFFITNNSTKSRPEFLEKCKMLNFRMVEEEIISTAWAAAKYLQNRNFQKKVYVIGSTGVAKELENVGIPYEGIGPDVLTGNLQNLVHGPFTADPEIGAVIVGFDEHFSFPKLFKAASYLDNPDCIFIATNTDERFPMSGKVIPGTGSIVRSVETAAERKAEVMGKPNPLICEGLFSDFQIDAGRTLMIGDRANTDIELGANCGFQTLLVGTGIHGLRDVEIWKKSVDPNDKKRIPDLYLPSLGDLLKYMS
ncbi:Glycerol-3-phosphate phosphatase [Pseudolycoriella hygida]|uniref:Glycerol-3-phosphate phosphatase n=1 Tax=Pseudolycoriella hygida TaxID=35572 RepID=A0A9Q0S5K6_9DIPT|nr:Glycerol-3-phosphate phosphatase [Pseudolycoriella hygida]